MKAPKNRRKEQNNEIHKYFFAQNIIIIFGLLIAFLVLSHMGDIFATFTDFFQVKEIDLYEMEKEKEIIHRYKKYENGLKNSSVENEKKNVKNYLWGNNTALTSMITFQLENMGEDFKIISQLDDCEDAEVLFVLNQNLDSSVFSRLMELYNQGTNLIFCDILNSEQEEYKELSGIKSVNNSEKIKGVRLCKNILFGEMTELKIETEVENIDLMNETEVYAHGIPCTEAKREVTDLAAVFWRHYNGNSDANVFVIDDKLLNSYLGYGIVSFLYTEMKQDYIYPVMNTNCFIVNGMPFSDQYSSSFMMSQYNRDSIGTQTDIFFPQMKRLEERYNLKISWCSNDIEQLAHNTNSILQYQMDSIFNSEDEIISLNSDHFGQANFALENQIVPMDYDFTWKDSKQPDRLQLPFMYMNKNNMENFNVYCESLAKAFGFYAININIEDFMLDKDENMGWVEWCLAIEGILENQTQDMPWLQSKTVSHAFQDLAKFYSRNANIEYNEKGIHVHLPQILSEEYFYLSTNKDFSVSEGIQIECLYDDFYLFKISKNDVDIVWN